MWWIEMASFPLRIMIAVLAIVATTVPSHAVARIFSCEIAHAQTLLGDGSLGPSNMTEMFVERRSLVRFDEASGLLRFDGFEPEHFDIVQEGTSQSDLVAVRELRGPAAVVLRVLQIRTGQDAMPFSFSSEVDRYSGTCHVEWRSKHEGMMGYLPVMMHFIDMPAGRGRYWRYPIFEPFHLQE
jgi:hypothetical protein